MITLYSAKVNAIATCYFTQRADGSGHEAAETFIREHPIGDSQEIEAGIRLGAARFAEYEHPAPA